MVELNIFREEGVGCTIPAPHAPDSNVLHVQLHVPDSTDELHAAHHLYAIVGRVVGACSSKHSRFK